MPLEDASPEDRVFSVSPEGPVVCTLMAGMAEGHSRPERIVMPCALPGLFCRPAAVQPAKARSARRGFSSRPSTPMKERAS